MEKPILFNTEMVKAILEGRKTTTRRIIKGVGNRELLEHEGEYYKFGYRSKAVAGTVYSAIHWCKPRYNIGDTLYVRETWQEWTGGYAYKVGGDYPQSFIDKWKPSIHMPKQAARIFLEVTDVRVERLKDITEEQAINEGVGDLYLEYIANCGDEKYKAPMKHETLAIDQFELLWNSTIKKVDIVNYGWEANPWIWVIDFEVVEK